MQVQNHRVPIQAVQFGKNGNWYNAQRTSDNFWTVAGFPWPVDFPVDVRIQGVNSQWVEDVVPSMSTNPVTGSNMVQFDGISVGMGAEATEGEPNSFTFSETTPVSVIQNKTLVAVVVVCAVVVLIAVVVGAVLIVRNKNAQNCWNNNHKKKKDDKDEKDDDKEEGGEEEEE